MILSSLQELCKRASFFTMRQSHFLSGKSLPALACVFLLLLSATALTGCESTPEEIPPDLSRMEMFQRAQEAADRNQWNLALRYYREFSRRFPEDRGAIMEARYEIAFISYKQKNYDEAREGFEAIIAAYEDEEARQGLPEWPLVLAGRLLEIIEERTGGTETGADEATDGNGTEGSAADGAE